MIIANRDKVSESFKIKPTNLKWYAAFHNERHHPHIHMVLYSQDPKEGFLSDKGIENIKSAFTNHIFKNELRHIHRKIDLVKREVKDMASILAKDNINNLNRIQSKEFNKKMSLLSERLNSYKGRKFYKYFPKDTKKIVNELIDIIEDDPNIRDLLDLYRQERNELFAYYGPKREERALKDIKEFNSIKNELIKIAADLDTPDLKFRKSINISMKVLAKMIIKHRNQFKTKKAKDIGSLDSYIKDKMMKRSIGSMD